MKRIVVATDGSPGADRALDYAAGLAKESGAEVTAATVMDGSGVPNEMFRRFTRSQQSWLEESLDAYAAEILNRARERMLEAGAPSVALVSRRGNVAQTIIEIADEVGADAIVVGKRGAGLLASTLLGSVSQKLVNLAPRVVIVVP